MTQTVIFTSSEEVANAIESGNFPTRQIDNEAFFIKYPNGEYVLRKGANIQVRDEEVDLEFVERQVNKRTPKKCKKKTIIFFPSDVFEPDGKLFAREGDLKINNGTHTAHIQMGLGIKSSQDYIVNFDTQLGGKISEAINLGNLLNRNDEERRACKKSDVKQIVLQMMAENEKDTGNAKLTEEQISMLLSQYNFINRHTIGQWTSHHSKVGGRRKPLISYTKGELEQAMNALASLDRYKDYAICKPRTLVAWFDTGVGAAFDEMAVQGKEKALIVLYCKTVAMVNGWEKGDYKKNIKEKLELYKEHYGRTIEVEMIRYE